MYWTFEYQGIKRVSWGAPRKISKDILTNLQESYTIPIYDGHKINTSDAFFFAVQGDTTLGLGDNVWIINYLSDVNKIKGRRRCGFNIATSPEIGKFYRNFFPKTFNYTDEYITLDEFNSYSCKLPSLYYWKVDSRFDKSWVDNKSIIERLYDWVGLQYTGIADFGEFTNEELLYPPNSFYEKFNINKKDKYAILQWHSSGTAKNLSPHSNVKILKHITEKYQLPVYVLGKLDNLNVLEDIKGVRNFSSKTTIEEFISFMVNSELIVCPDSAGVHLGEAYRIPTVGILATLPPIYIASKYKIPTFMFGNGYCRWKPCGCVELPLDICPPTTKNYCNVLTEIDLDMFDRCVQQTILNRDSYRSIKRLNFYESLVHPIILST